LGKQHQYLALDLDLASLLTQTDRPPESDCSATCRQGYKTSVDQAFQLTAIANIETVKNRLSVSGQTYEYTDKRDESQSFVTKM
jgi:hypothetical protein